jgi:hypothetical protein
LRAGWADLRITRQIHQHPSILPFLPVIPSSIVRRKASMTISVGRISNPSEISSSADVLKNPSSGECGTPWVFEGRGISASVMTTPFAKASERATQIENSDCLEN